jgi:septal ring factor EnvC (AmiA/AmiB activator)
MYPSRRYNRTPTNRTHNVRSSPVNPFLEYKKETTQSISDILNELKTVKMKLHTEIIGLKKLIFNLEQTSSTQEQTIFTQAAKTTTLENQLSNQAAHTTTLENQITNLAAHTTTLENQITNLAAHTTTLENQLSNQAAKTTTLENQLSNQADHLKMIDDALVKLNTLEEGNNLFETFINDYTLKYTDLNASHDIYKSRVDDIMSKENTNTCSILEGVANVNKDNTSNILLLLERLISQHKEQSSTTAVLIQNLKSPTDDIASLKHDLERMKEERAGYNLTDDIASLKHDLERMKEERYSSNLIEEIKDKCTSLKDNTEAPLPTTDDQVETTISDDTPKKRKYIRKKH